MDYGATDLKIMIDKGFFKKRAQKEGHLLCGNHIELEHFIYDLSDDAAGIGFLRENDAPGCDLAEHGVDGFDNGVNAEVLCKRRTAVNASRIQLKEGEVLLCHNLGQKKYHKLFSQCVDYSSDKSMAKVFCEFIGENKIHTTLLSI